MKARLRENRILRLLCLALLAAALVTAAAVLRYREGEINYYNSDATWHTLLTVQAYRETPASEHLFLPIVSLGGTDNKWIPWGATIPDSRGNYYYTSFSAAAYFLPWLFMKVFGLPVSEQSLYLFNTVLFAFSSFLWALLISMIYKDSENAGILSVVALVTYVLSPELLHGMGIVYWGQSVMQVTLLIQFIAWFQYKENHSRAGQAVFYGMALLNPYIEWTGYVANVGFALAEMVSGGRKQWKKSLGRAAALGAVTVASLALFAGHYLLRVDSDAFWQAMRARFMARNVTTDTALSEVLFGYLKSFGYLWILLLILIVLNIAAKRRIALRHGLLLLVFAFPLLENVLMKQHAVEYTYDRMKGIFLLSFLICELSRGLLERTEGRRAAMAGLIVLAAGAGICNFCSYTGNSAYIWETDYREQNERLAEYINREYEDSLLAVENGSVRGYMNLLFGRGIYEYVDAEALQETAASRGKRYAVILEVEDAEAWNMYRLGGAVIYDVSTGEIRRIGVRNGEVYDL